MFFITGSHFLQSSLYGHDLPMKMLTITRERFPCATSFAANRPDDVASRCRPPGGEEREGTARVQWMRSDEVGATQGRFGNSKSPIGLLVWVLVQKAPVTEIWLPRTMSSTCATRLEKLPKGPLPHQPEGPPPRAACAVSFRMPSGVAREIRQ